MADRKDVLPAGGDLFTRAMGKDMSDTPDVDIEAAKNGSEGCETMSGAPDRSDLRALPDQPDPLGALFGILLARTQVDYTDYRQDMAFRRIARRMTVLDIRDYDGYVDYCRANVSEVDALHRNLLVSATRFFRDPDQFDTLGSELRTALENRDLKNHDAGPVRVWVVGCATGEEAYSIAVTLAEILGGIDELAKRNVQIFATDIDRNAVAFARRGVYPIAAAQDIPGALLEKYFTVADTELRVRPELRAITLFSHHNVVRDPPFINVDLISIRNLLIDFTPASREHVLSRLHYAMGQGALLFLGTSETVGEMGAFFEGRRGAEKVFAKRRGMSGELSGDPPDSANPRGRTDAAAAPTSAEAALVAEMSLARTVAPNGMICTRNGNIIEVLGDLSPFMKIRAGASTALNLRMLIEPLRVEASSLIAVAMRNMSRCSGRWHAVSLPTGNRVRLQVFPYTPTRGGESHCLIAIDAGFEEEQDVSVKDMRDEEQRASAWRMEHDLRATRDALQHNMKELQSANNQLLTVNEELRTRAAKHRAQARTLEAVQEDLGIGFFSWDVENDTPRWNKRMFEILGYDAGTHIPSVESLLCRVDRDARDRVSTAFRRALEHGEAFAVTMPVTKADGSVTECACKGHVRRRADRKVSQVFGSLRRIKSSDGAFGVAQTLASGLS